MEFTADCEVTSEPHKRKPLLTVVQHVGQVMKKYLPVVKGDILAEHYF